MGAKRPPRDKNSRQGVVTLKKGRVIMASTNAERGRNASSGRGCSVGIMSGRGRGRSDGEKARREEKGLLSSRSAKQRWIDKLREASGRCVGGGCWRGVGGGARLLAPEMRGIKTASQKAKGCPVVAVVGLLSRGLRLWHAREGVVKKEKDVLSARRRAAR